MIDLNRRDPLVEQYSARIEHQLPWGTALTVGYAGAHAKNFPLAVNINQLQDGLYAQFAANAAGGSTTSYTATAAANPYYIPTVSNGSTSYATGSITNSTKIATGQLLLPYPQFSTVTLSQSAGYSLYNALNLKIQKRASKGLTVLFTYTLASNWDNLYGGGSSLNATTGPQDNYNLKGEYSRAVNDIPNRMAAGVTYVLPVGRGQTFFNSAPRIVDYADWRLQRKRHHLQAGRWPHRYHAGHQPCRQYLRRLGLWGQRASSQPHRHQPLLLGNA